MAQKNPPFEWPGFRGIDLSGNPAERPIGTARVCENYRVMPGNWLRLRSGRTKKAAPTKLGGAGAMGEIVEFMPFKAGSAQGSTKHILRTMDGIFPDYWELDMSTWEGTQLTATLSSETQNVRYSLGFATLHDSMIYGNGFGTRLNVHPSGSIIRSIPWLTSWDPVNGERFFGLFYLRASGPDLGYIPSLGRSVPLSGLVAFANGLGANLNTVGSATLWAGLHNTRTGHYSNGAYIGAISTSGAQTVWVVRASAGVPLMAAPYHNTAERDEIKLVFYATVDGIGNQVPYLIMNSTLDGPLTADLEGTADVSLSVTAQASQGWVLDLTKRMPVNNYPPRQMRDICQTRGRVWGITHNWDGVQQIGYEYEIKSQDIAGICWSYALGDVRHVEFAGDPHQSWDPRNFSPCPSGERPLRCQAAPNDVDVFVLTATRAFLAREQSDGLVEWFSLSPEHGLNPQSLRTVARSRLGICWVTQRNQIAILGNDLQVRILSGHYDQLLRDKTIVCGGFLFDSANEVDRYEVAWWSGTPTASDDFSGCAPSFTLCHDFRTGEAYTTRHDGVVITAIGQLANGSGKIYNMHAAVDLFGAASIYSVEGDPDDSYRVPTRDERVIARFPSFQSSMDVIPSATWESSWFTPDSSARTGITHIEVTGDVSQSIQLNRIPVSIEEFRDFAQVVAGSGELYIPKPVEQAAKNLSESNYAIYEAAERYAIHHKLRISHEAHATDQGTTYHAPGNDGVQEENFYGAIVDMKVGFDEGRNAIS